MQHLLNLYVKLTLQDRSNIILLTLFKSKGKKVMRLHMHNDISYLYALIDILCGYMLLYLTCDHLHHTSLMCYRPTQLNNGKFINFYLPNAHRYSPFLLSTSSYKHIILIETNIICLTFEVKYLKINNGLYVYL